MYSEFLKVKRSVQMSVHESLKMQASLLKADIW